MDLKKILAAATALACLTAPALAVDAGATGGLSVSPHAEGVCAPNTPIVQERMHRLPWSQRRSQQRRRRSRTRAKPPI